MGKREVKDTEIQIKLSWCVTVICGTARCLGSETEQVITLKRSSSSGLKLHGLKHMLTLLTPSYAWQTLRASLSVCWQLSHRETLRRKTQHSYIMQRLCQPWPQRTTINLITRSMWPNRTKTPRHHYNGLCCVFSSHRLCCLMLKKKLLLKYCKVHDAALPNGGGNTTKRA